MVPFETLIDQVFSEQAAEKIFPFVFVDGFIDNSGIPKALFAGVAGNAGAAVMGHIQLAGSGFFQRKIEISGHLN